MIRAQTKRAWSAFVALGVAGVLWTSATTPGFCDAPPPIVANLPTPGSYILYPIQRAPAETRLLNADGKAVRFDSVARGAVTALSFFYGHCADPKGCPVAWSVFESVRNEANADALLKSKLRLVFVSLDPTHDTPVVIRLLRDAENAADKSIPWEFLTSASYDDLAPLLREMGQDISFETDTAEQRTSIINHMLKVFLIDPGGWVREIYTTAFLTSDNLLNDARTLAMAHPEANNHSEAP